MAGTPETEEEFEDSTIEINSPSVANDALIIENDTSRLSRGKPPISQQGNSSGYSNL